MRRITKFLVDKHKIVLIIFIAIALVSAWLMTMTNINSDMTKYLPDDSPMKTGIGIMSDEFPPQSSFNLMLEGLPDNDKSGVQEYISGLDNVSLVSYEPGSEKYNAGEYTLYVITVEAASASPEVKSIVADIKDKYAGYNVTVSGDAVGNTAMDILPSLAGVAVVILIIILFIMCNSWVEPFLFLITIGVAVLINMGTNIIFESVSDITASIAAILQLVLSMDYSIMLLNRYRQEKQLTDNKYEAMKSALVNAFTSISSSSVTTIVGMLALMFMSFTIGMDLGLVLAKGVFLSLLCIFTVLPALILIFNNAIEKTAKKSLHVNMDKIGAFSYKARRVIPVAFVVLFAVSFYLRGNVSISYTMTDYYEINKIFNPSNPVVLLYENSDEEAVGAVARRLESDAAVESVSAYSTTLGREMDYAEFADAADMDEIFAAQMYCYYFDTLGQLPESRLAFGEFIRFVKEDVSQNELFEPFFTEEDLQMLDSLGGAQDELRLTADELAAYGGIDAAVAQQLYGFYFSQYGQTDDGSIAAEDLVRFLTAAAADPQFAQYFTEDTLARLAAMSGGDESSGVMEQEMTAGELAGYIGMDESMVKQLYYYYAASHGEAPQGTASLYDLMQFILNDVAADEQFSAYFTADVLSRLEEAKTGLEDGLKQLVGARHSRMLLELKLPEESDETFAFIAGLEEELDESLGGSFYLVGNSSMAYEMSRSFPQEMNFITILTAVAIFLVVAVAFRSLSVPLILVCIIQCAIFITMGSVYVQGSSIYYLPLLIVQCLLMGATVDYGILYTSYYREARRTLDRKNAVIAALNNAIHTILTSALILIIVTLVLGFMLSGSEHAISEILLIIARGGLCSTLLVVFILPGVLAAFDRFVCRKNERV